MSDPNTTPAKPYPELKATRRYRLGQREMTRLSLVIGLVLFAAVAFLGYRFFLNFKSKRDLVIAQGNLLSLYKAIRNYAQDWDEHLPGAENWTDAVAGYLSAAPGTPGGKYAALHGPGDNGEVSYVYNDLASGYNLEPNDKEKSRQVDLSRLVLLIERPGRADNQH